MEILNGICKLCFEKCGNCKPIDENTKKIFDMLLPNIDCTQTLMCKCCEEMLVKCFDFKVKCLRTQDYIAPFVNKSKNVELDLKVIYQNKHLTAAVLQDEDVCAFCMDQVKNCSALSLDVEDRDIMLGIMMEQCLPELDISIIKKPVICSHCHGSLESCFHFVTNCLVIEEKIKKYCETEDINNRSPVEPSNLPPRTVRDVTTSEVDTNLVGIINAGKQFCEDGKNPDERNIHKEGVIIKLEQMCFAGSEDPNDETESKSDSFVRFDDQRVNSEQQIVPNNVRACEEECNKVSSVKIEEIFCDENETKHNEQHFIKIEDRKHLFNAEIETKTEPKFDRFANDITLSQPEVSMRLQRREKRLLANLEGDLSKPHINLASMNKDNIHPSLCNCDSCLLKTKSKICPKYDLPKHEDPLKAKMHKCESCSFETKTKYYLKIHEMNHKDPAEVKMHKCDSCPFQTKRKQVLTRHLLVHVDPSEGSMYKCASCSFQTRWKHYLKKHLVNHKDPSEVTMYKCDSCSYQTRWKHHMEIHLQVHRDPSQATMYKCDFCPFQTKFSRSLKTHELAHRDPSEATIYKCNSCSFQTKRKDCLTIHMLKHKDPSQVTMYECYLCFFQSKHKHSLKKHLLVHKGTSEVTMYKCDSCDFQTKFKSSLREHSLKHKKPSEITLYKCSFCPFETKHKYYVKRHELAHANSRKK